MKKNHPTGITLCILAVFSMLLCFTGCGGTKKATPGTYSHKTSSKKPKPYKVMGKYYQPLANARGFSQTGHASWYGKKFHGRKTANGETYDMYGLSAAHKTLPLGTYVRVNNLKNGKTLDVRVNDRGPFVRGRIIDLSYGAAKKLGVVGPGVAPVKITALGNREKKATSGNSGYRYKPVDYYSGNFTVQVGAFTSKSNAQRLVKKLSAKYGSAHIVKYKTAGGVIFYRVRVGSFSSLADAEKFEGRMINSDFSLAFTVAE